MKFYLLRLFLIVLVCLSLFACGRKGPPVWTDTRPPEPPKKVEAHYRPDVVLLSWSTLKGEGAPQEYIVYRAEETGSYSRIGSVSSGSYKDRTIAPYGTYRYRVSSVSVDGLEGTRSRVVAVGPDASIAGLEGLRAEIVPEGVRLEWDAIDNVSGYHVYVSAMAGIYPPAPLTPKPVVESAFVDISAPVGDRFYVVRAVRLASDGSMFAEGPASVEVRVRKGLFTPSAPTGMDGVLASTGATLFWVESPEAWAKSYLVYRAVDDGEFKSIARTRTPAFTDKSLPKGKLSYRVAAVGPGGEGQPSETVSFSISQ